MMWFVSLVIINIILPCCLGEESATADGSHWMDFWVVRLLLNLLGYATIFVPGFLLMRYLRKLPVQSVPITTKVVSSNPVHGKVYSIQHYVIKFISYLQHVSGFLGVLQFPPTIKLIATI
jgi:hypothetical protein